MILVALFAAIGLALIHLLTGKIRFLKGIPRSRWLSIAGGASVAYVFLHLLPELSAHQEAIAARLPEPFKFIEHHIYLVSLVGLATFYGLERLAKRSRAEHPDRDRTRPPVFWIHIVSFAIYNFLIGYLLLHLEEPTYQALTLFAIAMAFHFIVNDYGLEDHHEEAYERTGRWILVAAILLGWGVGYLTEISEFMIAVLIAFLAGGVILNVLKEELPEERESRFSAFALGAATYAALLLFM